MKFYADDGTLEIWDDLILRRGMIVPDFLASSRLEWEGGGRNSDSAQSTFDLFPNGVNKKVFLYVRYSVKTGIIWQWAIGSRDVNSTLVPWEEGQRKPRRIVKLNRDWFNKTFSARIPVKAQWGRIDAHYDKRNNGAWVECEYKEYLDIDWSQVGYGDRP